MINWKKVFETTSIMLLWALGALFGAIVIINLIILIYDQWIRPIQQAG